MMRKKCSLGTVAALALAGATVCSLAGMAFADNPEGMEDVLFMSDGRVLHGEILTETKSAIVFKVIDRKLGLETTITVLKSDVDVTKQDVAIGADGASAPASTPAPRRDAAPGDAKKPTFGRGRDDTNMGLPGLYIVPMRGQLGTDINPQLYDEIAADIRAQQPSTIIFKMDCEDIDTLMISMSDRAEQSMFLHHEFREIVDLFRDELRNIPQVMWVEDAYGFSALLALAWPDMYMTPDARLGGLGKVGASSAGWSDADVQAKMEAAWDGIAAGFLANGNRSKDLGLAMFHPKYALSASFEGRQVKWSLNTSGEYTVDGSDKQTTWFRANQAENFCVSNGTVETVDDLAFLLGYREYRVIDGDGERIVDDYIKSWRRAFENCREWLQDAQQYEQWANGEDAIKYTSMQKSTLEKVLSMMRRYKAVEIRMQQDFGLTILALEIRIEQLEEQLRGMRRGAAGGNGRNPGGGGGGPGPGGR